METGHFIAGTVTAAVAALLLYKANAMRLKIAQNIIDRVLDPYKNDFDALQDYEPVVITDFSTQAEKLHQKLQSIVDENVARREKAFAESEENVQINIPRPGAQIFDSSESFDRYIRQLLGSIKKNFAVSVIGDVTVDAVSDTILRTALIRAFPDVAAQSGVDTAFQLPASLVAILDETHVIDFSASFLKNVGGIVSEKVVVDIVKTASDPNLAIFTLLSITGREIGLVRAGYSTPGESLKYGALEYGARAAAATAGGVAGGAIGRKVAPKIKHHRRPVSPNAGSAAGMVVGAVVGNLAAKAAFRKALKEEIKSLAAEYKVIAKGLDTKKQHAANKMADSVQATVRSAQINFKNALRACPDITQTPEFLALAGRFAEAFHEDMATIKEAVEAKVQEIVAEESPPEIRHILIGADWRRTVKKRVKAIAETKTEPYSEMAKACGKNNPSKDPKAVISAGLKTPFIKDGAVSKLIHESADGALEAVKVEGSAYVQDWENKCSDVWRSAEIQVVQDVHRKVDILKREYDSLVADLGFRQRQILNKSARLVSKGQRKKLGLQPLDPL